MASPLFHTFRNYSVAESVCSIGPGLTHRTRKTNKRHFVGSLKKSYNVAPSPNTVISRQGRRVTVTLNRLPTQHRSFDVIIGKYVETSFSTCFDTFKIPTVPKTSEIFEFCEEKQWSSDVSIYDYIQIRETLNSQLWKFKKKFKSIEKVKRNST
jgi:hypothetical protein